MSAPLTSSRRGNIDIDIDMNIGLDKDLKIDRYER